MIFIQVLIFAVNIRSGPVTKRAEGLACEIDQFDMPTYN
jgi:hypothetical protein